MASPNPFDLGSIGVGTPGTGQFSLTDTVSETATLTLGTGGDCAQFSITTTATPALSTTATMVVVQLQPTSTGAKSCSITVTSSQPTVTVMLTGTGTGTPQISVAPTTLLFGDNEVGHASPTQRVTASNPGNAPLVISGVSIAANATSYVVTGTTGAQTVNPGGMAQWDIACKPAQPNTVDSVFRISSNGAGNPTVNVSLVCNGTRGFLAADQPTLAFGGAPLNGSVTRTVTLSNTGSLTVSGITGVFDRPTAGYSIDPTTPVPAALASGASATLKVNFAPTKVGDGGAAKITLSGTWGAGGANSTTAQIALTGVTIDVGVSPVTLDFGSFLFDSRPTQVFHIINNGGNTVAFDAPTFVPDTGTSVGEVVIIVIKNGATTVTLPSSLASGQQLDVTVGLAPNARAGTVSGHFLVHSTTPGIPDQTIAVTAIATTSTISIANVDFDKVDIDEPMPQTKTATLTNTGAHTIHVSGVTPTGASGPFTITPPALPVDLAPGAALQITVAYKPVVAKGADMPDTTALDIGVSGILGMTSAHVTVSGRGIDRVFVLGSAPVFPPTFRNPGTKATIGTVTVRNDGEAVLKVTNLVLTGDPVWTLVEASPVDIPGLSSHDFIVRFAPTATGDAPTGQLTIMDDDDATPVAVIPLDGEGKARNVVFGPATVDLGVAVPGGQLTYDSLQITNMDPSETFNIRAIELSQDSPWQIVNIPADTELPPGASQRIAIQFDPTMTGRFEATATLFLDEDPEQQAQVTITGEADGSVAIRGGGGCATGHGAGGGAAIALMALVARRRRRRATVIAVIAGVLALNTPQARADNVVIGVFDPTPATSGPWFQLTTPEVGAPGTWVISSVASYATDVLVVDNYRQGMLIGEDHAIKQRTMLTLGGAYAFWGRFEAGLRLPLYSQHGDSSTGDAAGPTYITPATGTAIGDLTLHVKARLARVGSATIGAGLQLTLPSATAGQFIGVDGPTVRAQGVIGWTPLARVSLSAAVGGVLRQTAVYRDAASISQGSGLVWGVGLSYRLFDRLWATGEMFGEAVSSGRSELGMNTLALAPIEGLAGARYDVDRRLSLGLAMGRGLSEGIGAPALRGVVTLAYSTGAPDREPIPHAAVVAAVLDTDGDGIPDAVDRCPQQAEDKDGFQDDDGCPDLDNDDDGIPDVLDKCPNQAEDKDGFQDEDGCPDPDNDGDGIPDVRDKCPNEPETVNGFEDEDGCPDQAKPGATAPITHSATSAAEVTFTRGRELLKQAKYREACAAFEQSQQLDPQFGTQYNIAGCDEKIGKLATAWNLYRGLARSDTNAARRAKSRDLAAALARRVPKIKLVLTKRPAGLQVAMNGMDATALLDIETPADLGSYELVVTAAGYGTWKRAVELKDEGKVVTVRIELEPAR